MILQGTVRDEIVKIIKRKQADVITRIHEIESDNRLRKILLDKFDNNEEGYLGIIIKPKQNTRPYDEALLGLEGLEAFVKNIFKPSPDDTVRQSREYRAMALWVLRLVRDQFEYHDRVLDETKMRFDLEESRLAILKKQEESEFGNVCHHAPIAPIPEMYIEKQAFWKEVLNITVEILINRGFIG